MLSSDQIPFRDELDRRVNVFTAIQARKSGRSNIWFFDSPKNNTRVKIETDLAFMHLVLLEGTRDVLGYVPVNRDDYSLPANSPSAAKIQFRDGHMEWWDFERLQKDKLGRKPSSRSEERTASSQFAANKIGAVYAVKTDLELKGQEILFDNWITICAAITRCRGLYLGKEAELFFRRIELQEATTLDCLLNLPDIDVAHMLAVVGAALQTGEVRTNLQSQLLSRHSLISSAAS